MNDDLANELERDKEIAVERLVERMIRFDNNQSEFADPYCKSCSGRGIVFGGMVEYWGQTVAMPNTFCDCSPERISDLVYQKLATGELQLDYTNDEPFICGAEEAGLIDE